MAFSRREQAILGDMEKAGSIFPDLKELLLFYEKIFRMQFSFKYRLGREGNAGCWEKRGIDLRRLENGDPQICFEELGLRPDLFHLFYREILGLLIPYAAFVGDPGGESSPEEITGYAREIFLGRGPLVVSGVPFDIFRTASGLALAPYLQLVGEWILPRIPPDSWHRAYCPVCGGKPAFAALTSDTGPRTLMCPRCFGEWNFNRIGCPFCSARSSQTYYLGSDGRYRLYVCEACLRYLKTADIREQGPGLCLPVANIVTVSMDLAARENGYVYP